MTNFIPIFPLGIVVFPEENLNLHIFEPRYRQLIQECFVEKKPFGIPTVLNNGIAEMGTLVQIQEIAKLHEDGKMDIKTQGLKIFSILEIVKDLPEKMYSGAIVSYPANDEKHLISLLQNILIDVRELHTLLNIKKDFKKEDDELSSYDIAHHAGLSLQEEYELLCLLKEEQRLQYLKRHLQKILPLVSGIENLKDKIKLNGHFKELKGFNL